MNDMKTKLTPHFTLEEMTVTKTGLENVPNFTQINNLRILCRDILEPLREILKSPIIINSAFRSPDVNLAVGGVITSQHLSGDAADIHCDTVPIYFVWNAINTLVNDRVQFNVGQCILYRKSNFIHISNVSRSHTNDFIIRNK